MIITAETTKAVDAALADLIKWDEEAEAGWPSGYDKEKAEAAVAKDFRVLDVALMLAPGLNREAIAKKWVKRLKTRGAVKDGKELRRVEEAGRI